MLHQLVKAVMLMREVLTHLLGLQCMNQIRLIIHTQGNTHVIYHGYLIWSEAQFEGLVCISWLLSDISVRVLFSQ